MTKYVKLKNTSDSSEANEMVKKGWDLIDTFKVVQSDEYGDPIGSYPKYVLGLSSKEYENKLVSIIKEYEKHGLKEILFEKVAGGQGKQPGADSPLRTFMTEYEEITNIKEVPNSKKDNDDMPFVIGDINF